MGREKRAGFRFFPGRGFWLGLAAAAAAAGHLLLYARLSPEFVDATYREGIYPLLLGTLGRVADLFPCSISGFLVLFLGVLLFLRTLRLLASIGRPGFFLRTLGAGVRLVLLLSLLLHPFLLCWGYHYRGTPLARRIGLHRPDPGRVAPLLLGEAARRTGELRRRVLAREGPPPPLDRVVEAGLERLGLSAPDLPGRIKHPPIAGMLAAQGVTGVISPFTLEAHVESDLHWAQFPFTAAHELAHLAGIPGEGEANFVAWYCLATASHPLHRYSAWLGIMRLTGGWKDSALPAAVRGDLAEIARKNADRQLAVVAGAQRFIYDLYLRSQSIEEGIADYREGAALAAGWLVANPGGLNE